MNGPVFVSGPMCDPVVLDRVLGAAPLMEPAVLADHCALAGQGPGGLILSPAPDQSVPGHLLPSLSDHARARLTFFMQAHGARPRVASVETGSGSVAVQIWSAAVTPGARPWTAELWAARDARIDRELTREIMQRQPADPDQSSGQGCAEDIAPILAHLRARAWARLRAADHPHPTELRRKGRADDVAELRLRQGHDGFFRLRAFEHRNRQFDGSLGPALRRECFIAFDAALVLPYDPARDLVLLVEQFRYGPYWRGDPEHFVLEPVAGLVDAGESPEKAARREAREEAGLEIDRLLKVGAHYPSPGYVTEFYHSYVGLCRLDPAMAGLGGLQQEGEDIRSHVLPFARAMDLVETGEITTLPLAMMLMWLGARREGLRSRA